eukprot:6201363-Pleurochrysis_carterae.AAC.1
MKRRPCPRPPHNSSKNLRSASGFGQFLIFRCLSVRPTKVADWIGRVRAVNGLLCFLVRVLDYQSSDPGSGNPIYASAVYLNDCPGLAPSSEFCCSESQTEFFSDPLERLALEL